MKKTAVKKAVDRADIFKDAKKVFSKSYVNMLSEKGHDFLEQDYEGSFTFDSEGKRYLDCYTSGAVFNLGRKNRAIIQRFKKAIYETDQGNFVMPSHEKALLAKRIAEFMPSNLDCVLFGVTRENPWMPHASSPGGLRPDLNSSRLMEAATGSRALPCRSPTGRARNSSAGLSRVSR